MKIHQVWQQNENGLVERLALDRVIKYAERMSKES